MKKVLALLVGLFFVAGCGDIVSTRVFVKGDSSANDSLKVVISKGDLDKALAICDGIAKENELTQCEISDKDKNKGLLRVFKVKQSD